MKIEKILEKFGLFQGGEVTISQIHEGLINHTWKIDVNNDSYIFQRVNSDVFKRPEDIAYNIEAIAGYLHRNFPEYFFVQPLASPTGNTIFFEDGLGYYRAFPFVKNSHSKTTVQSADEAFEAARQFARFTAVCSEFDASSLKTTIPDFHNLSLRFNQFLTAVSEADSSRKAQAEELIRELQDQAGIVQEYKSITRNVSFKTRVTHHDTKISNVLFDENNKGICVIDLDTVMPGLFISDVGDMMRTYLSPVSEEERDFEKIMVRSDIYQAIVSGYISEMGDELTGEERNSFFYAGSFMIYMQALRFLTDYLNGDIYYHPEYPLHNFNRAKNQTVLLQQLMNMRAELTSKAIQRKEYL